MKQKGFIQILLFIIVSALITVVALNTVLFLSKNKELPSLKASVSPVISPISELIYKTLWEKKFEMKELEQKVELSKIREERAEKHAQEETTKRLKEEVAREEAEQKAQEEAVKRSQAEAKAKQEEFEKKLKEQELAEKEAEEKRMNADNDSDGLTYRRELELGSSDWNTDSDSDGINDKEDIHPTGGGRYDAQYFSWNYDNTPWEWKYSIHEDWHAYYKNKPRLPPGAVYVTYNDNAIKAIATKLKETAESRDYHKTSFVVSFIQGLPYVEDYRTGYDELHKYPVETLIDRNGDCEDTAYLAASIINAMNIDCVLVLLPGHMAIGIWTEPSQSGTYYESNGRRYYYFETTAEGWKLGDIPDEFRYTPATLIEIPSGETVSVYPEYKKPCYASPDFPGYYSDGENFYSDGQCNSLTYCLPYKEYYVRPTEVDLYWDSSCTQIVVEGCYKSTEYPGYFFDSFGFYHDYQCLQKARICRPSSIYSDRYWDGNYSYWDSNCIQKVVSWCSKSTYHPEYFFNSLDYEYYYDYQCTQKADL